MAYDFGTVRPSIQARRKITEDLRKYNVQSIVLSPNRWETFKSGLNLDWKLVKFKLGSIEDIPDDKFGVYSFVVEPGIANHPRCSYLLYIGKAEVQMLRDRLKQYFYEPSNPKGRGPIQDMIIDWPDHLFVCYAVVEDTTIIDDLENSLVEAFVPPLNQQYRGELGQAVRAWRTRS